MIATSCITESLTNASILEGLHAMRVCALVGDIPGTGLCWIALPEFGIKYSQ